MLVKGKASTGMKKGSQVVHHKLVHHETLSKLIEELESAGLLFHPPEGIERWRSDTDKAPYLLTTGYVGLDDFAQLREFTRSFAWLTDYLITLKTESEPLTENQERVIKLLIKAHQALDDACDGTKEAKLKEDLRKARTKLHEEFKDSGLGLPDWTLESIDKWISVFSASRLRMRMNVPHEEPFKLIADLDKNKFVDNSIEQTMASYGQRPNQRLTLLCLATNVPDPAFEHPISLMADRKSPDSADSAEQIQAAFDKVFEMLIDVKSNMNGTIYPDIVVYPIAVFREFKISK